MSVAKMSYEARIELLEDVKQTKKNKVVNKHIVGFKDADGEQKGKIGFIEILPKEFRPDKIVRVTVEVLDKELKEFEATAKNKPAKKGKNGTLPMPPK